MLKETNFSNGIEPFQDELTQQHEAKDYLERTKNGQSINGFQHFLDKHPKVKTLVRASILVSSLGNIPSGGHGKKTSLAQPTITSSRRDESLESKNLWNLPTDEKDDFMYHGGDPEEDAYTVMEGRVANERKFDLPTREKLIFEAATRTAERDPSLIIGFGENFHDKPWIDKMINKILSLDPTLIISNNKTAGEKAHLMKRINPDISSVLNNILNFNIPEAENEDVTAFKQREKLIKTRMSTLLDGIIHKRLTVGDAFVISQSDTLYFHALLLAQNQENYTGENAVQKSLQEIVRPFVLQNNELHKQFDEIRFKNVENSTAAELYSMLVYGDGHYTSTFNGLFNRMIEKMRKEGISGDMLIHQVGVSSFRIFFRQLAEFDRLTDFLATMDTVAQRQIFEDFFVKGTKTQSAKALPEVIAIAEFTRTVHDPKVRKIFSQKIKEKYEQMEIENNQEGLILYGLLASSVMDNVETDKEWFLKMGERYELPNYDKLTITQLTDTQGRNVQQYFFFKDEDGENSYKGFISEYEGKSEWKVDKKDGYVHIESTKGEKKIEIFANYPKTDIAGIKHVREVLEEQGKHPQIYSPRSHSYHLDDAIPYISSDAVLALLGPCGGERSTNSLLEQSIKIHLISTKGTGTQHVNNTLAKMVNDYILRGKDIVWKDFWDEARINLKNDPDFPHYVSPNTNLATKLIRAYHEIKSKDNPSLQAS